jgi:16S rRNA C967 or C1407 C5-methylase (RsmB/RsmF family)
VKRNKASTKNGHKTDGESALDAYFQEVYGERWAPLKQNLLGDISKETLINPFGRDLQDYSLDRASLLPVKNLKVEKGQHIADFCASPGGKSLAMIFALGGEAFWWLNDLSPARVGRLRAILHDCVPPELLKNIDVKCSDASRWGMNRKEHFDRVLVDAPCSGERHLLNSKQEVARWSLKGSKRLVIRQHSLLCSAFDSLKPGGRLVYSTCSINPLENDGVIERLHGSREGFTIAQPEADFGEATKYGWIVLPDTAKAGPIYFSVIDKN